MKFATRLSIMITALFLTSFCAFFYLVYTSTTAIVEQNARERLEGQAFQIIDKIDRTLFERFADMSVLATDTVLGSRTSTPLQITQRLSQYREKYRIYSSLSFFSMDRVRIADTSGNDIGKQHALTPYWQEIADGKDMVMTITESRTEKQMMIHFVATVRDSQGRRFGVVASRMPIETIHQIADQTFRSGNSNKARRVELLDANGKILYSTYRGKDMLRELSSDWENIKGLLAQGKSVGSSLDAFQGEDEITAFARERGYDTFKGNNWVLTISLPVKTAFAAAHALAKKFSAFFLGIGLIMILSTFLVSRAATKPLHDLARAADEIGKGGRGISVKVRSNDDIGQLAKTFNAMALNLRKSEEEIMRAKEELEFRVEERTRQLIDAQEELVRKEKLATLGQLSGSVGHELRNPMAVINNAVYFLQTIMPDADDTVREYLTIIKSEVNAALRIITDLLDFTRTNTPQAEVIPVADLIKQSMGKCLVPASVSLSVNVPDILPAVKVDPLQIEQVFQNLIANAVQAMPDVGKLQISARKAGIRGLVLDDSEKEPKPKTQPPIPDREFIEISVTDTGEGISAENMKRLFQPLFTTKARGIGLGLIVSKNLAEANGGMIEVKSQLGKGTTFTVMLPAESKGQILSF